MADSDLPTADEAFGPAPDEVNTDSLPTADEAFASAKPPPYYPGQPDAAPWAPGRSAPQKPLIMYSPKMLPAAVRERITANDPLSYIFEAGKQGFTGALDANNARWNSAANAWDKFNENTTFGPLRWASKALEFPVLGTLAGITGAFDTTMGALGGAGAELGHQVGEITGQPLLGNDISTALSEMPWAEMLGVNPEALREPNAAVLTRTGRAAAAERAANAFAPPVTRITPDPDGFLRDQHVGPIPFPRAAQTQAEQLAALFGQHGAEIGTFPVVPPPPRGVSLNYGEGQLPDQVTADLGAQLAAVDPTVRLLGVTPEPRIVSTEPVGPEMPPQQAGPEQPPANVAQLPVVHPQAFRTLAEEATLLEQRTRNAETLATAPSAEAVAAADRLNHLQAVEQQLADPNLTPEARKTLMDRRDQILVDTTPEQLRAQAAPVFAQQLAERQQANIEARLAEINEARLHPTTLGELSSIPRPPENMAQTIWRSYAEGGVLPAEIWHDAQFDPTVIPDLMMGKIPTRYLSDLKQNSAKIEAAQKVLLDQRVREAVSPREPTMTGARVIDSTNLPKDTAAARDEVIAQVRQALAEGRDVRVVMGGQAHPIVGVNPFGIVDDQGIPWGTTGLLGGVSHIEIGAAPVVGTAGERLHAVVSSEMSALDQQMGASRALKYFIELEDKSGQLPGVYAGAGQGAPGGLKDRTLEAWKEARPGGPAAAGEVDQASRAAQRRSDRARAVGQVADELKARLLASEVTIDGRPLTDEEATHFTNFMAANYGARAAALGMNPLDLMRQDGITFARGETLGSEAGELYQTVSIRQGKETLKKYGLDPGVSHTVRAVAEALEKRQLEKYGRIQKNDRSPGAAKKIAKWIGEEIRFSLQQAEAKIAAGLENDSGVGWYSKQFQGALTGFGKQFPEMLGPEQYEAAAATSPGLKVLGNSRNARNFFTSLIAITSDGQKVYANFAMAVRLYREFRKDGFLNPETNFGGQRNLGLTGNIKVLQKLLDEHGPAGMHTYLMEEKPVSELKADAKALGQKLKSASSYQADMTLPRGALVFGPKLGAFYANLMGAEGFLTMDRWWSRSFNRYRGLLIPHVGGRDLPGPPMPGAEFRDTRFDTKGEPVGLHRFKTLLGDPLMSDGEAFVRAWEARNTYAAKGFKQGTDIEKAANTIFKVEAEAIEDMPFNAGDREFMVRSAKQALAALRKQGHDMTLADLQAVLWYYEKKLYGHLGARQSASISYLDTARRINQEIEAGTFDKNVVQAKEVKRDENGEAIEDEDEEIGPDHVHTVDNEEPTLEQSPLRLFHGTAAEFKKFRLKRSDLGVHLGTIGQASDRLEYLGGKGRYPEGGENIRPVLADIRNPLRLDDLGQWDADNVRLALQRYFPDTKDQIALHSMSLSQMRDFIRSKGYDGIVYKNTGETHGAASLQAEADRLSDAAFKGKSRLSLEDQKSPEYLAYQQAQDRIQAYREANAEDSYIALDPKQIRSAITLDQSPTLSNISVPGLQLTEGPRGSIRLGDNGVLIKLFHTADPSTMVHEAWHLFWDNLMRDATRPEATPEIIANRNAVLDHFGVADPLDLTRDQHEQLARWGEMYAREGRAPSNFLAKTFQAFKGWLTSVYQTVTDLGEPIPDAIRKVMDQLLTTPEERAASTFVSPNVAELDLSGAKAGLTSPRQMTLSEAANAVDKTVGIASDARPVIGAWADGAENSLMISDRGGATPEQIRVAAAMKASLADQKATLVFTPGTGGPGFLATFTLPMDVDAAHKALLQGGLPFHTLSTDVDGATRVHVYGSDQETLDAISKVAPNFEMAHGNGEFIGTEKQDGTDRQQRDDAQAKYDAIIRGAEASGQLPRGAWEKLRADWGKRLSEAAPAATEPAAAVEPAEAPGGQRVAGRSLPLKPIPGTGPAEIRGLSEHIEESAIAADLTNGFGDLPEYRTLSMADQAARAGQILRTDPQYAVDIAMGRKTAPAGVAPEALLVAVEKAALATNNVTLLRELALNSRLNVEATTMGQRIRILGERDPTSPTAAIRMVQDIRDKAIKKPAIAAQVGDIAKEVTAATSGRDVWENFIKSIQC